MRQSKEDIDLGIDSTLFSQDLLIEQLIISLSIGAGYDEVRWYSVVVTSWEEQGRPQRRKGVRILCG
jgi:hypothetical protein